MGSGAGNLGLRSAGGDWPPAMPESPRTLLVLWCAGCDPNDPFVLGSGAPFRFVPLGCKGLDSI